MMLSRSKGKSELRQSLAASILRTRVQGWTVGAQTLGSSLARDLATVAYDARRAVEIASSLAPAYQAKFVELTKAAKLGELEGSPAKAALDALRSRAETIAITEANTAATAARERVALGYVQAGAIVEGEWEAERDKATCDYCRGLDGATRLVGKTFYPGNAEPGHVHPRCRCRESFRIIG